MSVHKSIESSFQDGAAERPALQQIAGQSFDVAIIGGGINGVAACQKLLADGYRVILLEKEDFASGSSSRSARLLPMGLADLEPGGYMNPSGSVTHFLKHPTELVAACRKARVSVKSRAELISTMPESVSAFNACYPIYADGHFSGWQFDAAFKLLSLLGPENVPLDYRRLNAKEALTTSLLSNLRQDGLKGVAIYRDHIFDWPERVVVDIALACARAGAIVRNYTEVNSLERVGDRWTLQLRDALEKHAASIQAKAVLNMAGPMIDTVNDSISGQKRKKLITRTKGTHILVSLGEKYSDYGIFTHSRKNEHFVLLPWHGFHYIGPTFSLYEGDVNKITATEEEIAYLLEEANHLLPRLGLARSDVVYSWAGVRPLTKDPKIPFGTFSREVHDLSQDGPPLFALTGGPFGDHRLAARAISAAVKGKLDPSGPSGDLSYHLPRSPSLKPFRRHISTEARDFEMRARHAVCSEHARSIVDVMFRRTGVGWSQTMGCEFATSVATILGDNLGWNEAQRVAATQDYFTYLREMHGFHA